MIEPLKKAVEIAGGQAHLARAIGVRQQHVWNWLNRDRKTPPEHVVAIERAVEGQVTRYDLRPDVFGEPPQVQQVAA